MSEGDHLPGHNYGGPKQTDTAQNRRKEVRGDKPSVSTSSKEGTS